MPRHCVRWRLALLIAGGFVLALAGSLAACGDSSDDDPPPVAPAEQPAAARTTPSAETVPASAATPDPPVAPVEPPVPDPPTLPARVAPEPATGPAALPAEVSTSPAETTFAESVTSPPTPAPHPGVALIEPAPGAFEQRTFATGERIEWRHGIFVLDPETGETEGYRAPAAADPDNYWLSLLDGWIGVQEQTDLGSEPFTLLLDRATGQSWRWPSDRLRLAAASSEHLLFEERSIASGRHFTGRFTLANRAMEAVGHFSIAGAVDRYRAVFSPDGQTIALSAADTVYLVPVESAQPVVLFKAEATDGQASAFLPPRYTGPRIRVYAFYRNESGEVRQERHYFSWTGAPLPCQGQVSPDWRYVAWLDGGYVEETHSGVQIREDPWPSIVIADAATCAPLFRVRSAHTYELVWDAAWLPSSDGFVIGVHDGYMILRVRPAPDLVRLPGRGAGLANPAGDGGGFTDFYEATNRLAGPEPAPTGDGRYFGYGPNVYDALEDRWLGPAFVRDGPFGWADSHRERWFVIKGYWGEGWVRWLLLPPKIEFPPFSDETAFRVAGTGSCLRLREAPGEESGTKDCLPDGERLILTKPNEPVRAAPHPAVFLAGRRYSPVWIHVRTEDGAEGWVSHDYLEHD